MHTKPMVLQVARSIPRVALTLVMLPLMVQSLHSVEPRLSRILFGSCVKQEQPMPILDTVLGAQPELFIFLGDNIYGDTDDMSVMKAKYETLAANPRFARLRERCRLLATWDDHDYGVNDGGADFIKRAESQQAFLDFWNEPADSPRQSRPGVYASYSFGQPSHRVQVIMLDTRYFRSPLRRGERRTGGPYYPDPNPEKTMLGDAQWTWLEGELRKPAQLRIVATSIQCVAEAAGQETWSNLPLERQRLFDLIGKTEAGGVLLISGDRHWAELSRASEGLAYPLYDITSSSLNQLHARGTPTTNRFRADDSTYHRENFGVIEIDWSARSPTSDRVDPTITIEIRDASNQPKIQRTLRLSSLQPQ